MTTCYEIEDAIMQLHNIARLIECEVGFGTLAQDVRRCAYQLHILTSPLDIPEKI
jgi:hypothetical protein